jgi:hypothetical protein
VNRELAQTVRERAGERCEYCRVPQSALQLRFQVDHIIAGLDSQSGQLVRLFHPRTDDWNEHFQFVEALLVGTTSVGRATVQVLAMNADEPLRFRTALLQEGVILS